MKNWKLRRKGAHFAKTSPTPKVHLFFAPSWPRGSPKSLPEGSFLTPRAFQSAPWEVVFGVPRGMPQFRTGIAASQSDLEGLWNRFWTIFASFDRGRSRLSNDILYVKNGYNGENLSTCFVWVEMHFFHKKAILLPHNVAL